MNPAGRQSGCFALYFIAFSFKALPTRIVHKTQCPPALGESQIRIVFT